MKMFKLENNISAKCNDKLEKLEQVRLIFLIFFSDIV